MSRPTRGPWSRFPVRGCHPLRPAFPGASGTKNKATGLFRVRSPLLAESPGLCFRKTRLMSVPPATEMFQFAGFASRPYEFRSRYPGSRGGLPHSEIPGSPIARISPGLFAACHVLHRLSVPRHPPDALLFALDPRRNSVRRTKPPAQGKTQPRPHEDTLACAHGATWPAALATLAKRGPRPSGLA